MRTTTTFGKTDLTSKFSKIESTNSSVDLAVKPYVGIWATVEGIVDTVVQTDWCIKPKLCHSASVVHALPVANSNASTLNGTQDIVTAASTAVKFTDLDRVGVEEKVPIPMTL